MRGAKTTVGGSALLVALLLGAPGCASASAVGPVGEPAVATAGLEPSASVTTIGGASAGGGLGETCGAMFSMPSNGEMLAIGALVLLVSPFLLVYAVVGTPLRILSRRR